MESDYPPILNSVRLSPSRRFFVHRALRLNRSYNKKLAGGTVTPVSEIHERDKMDEDYYKLLGINRNASAADIQKAYRDLARKYHPDLNPDDKSAKAKFQAVQKAYEVLSDNEKREMYDRYGSSFDSAGGAGPQGASWRVYPGGGPGSAQDFDFSQFFGERYGDGGTAPGGGGGFGDIFRQFTQGSSARARPTGRRSRGVDLEHSLSIPFTVAITGGESRLKVKRSNGSVETITVKIPPGIEDGKKIRLRGQGEAPGRGGTPGDILITVRVGQHPCFQRRGNDLTVKVPLTLAEAVFGGKVDVPTPNGTVALTVPAGSSSGRRLRIKGQGVPASSGSSGDLFAEIQIVLPEAFDDQSKDWIRKIDEKSPQKNLRCDLKW
jgi:DnaJ-class molecular chaperone